MNDDTYALGRRPLARVSALDEAAAQHMRGLLEASAANPRDAARIAYPPSLDSLLGYFGIRGRLLHALRGYEDEVHTDCLVVMALNVWEGTHLTLGAALAGKEFLANNLDSLADVNGRFLLAREALRLAAESSFRVLADTPNFATYVMLSAAPATLAGRIDADAVRRALVLADDAVMRRRADAFRIAMGLVGLRPRRGERDFSDLPLTFSVMMWGFVHRHMLAPELVDRRVERNEGDFHVTGALAEGYLREWLEPDPDYDAARALEQFLVLGLTTSRPGSQIVQIPRSDA